MNSQENLKKVVRLRIYTDGACRGNHSGKKQGEMSAAFLAFEITPDEQFILRKKWSCRLGKGTNNIAEYMAIMKSVCYINKLYQKYNTHFQFKITLFSDSELVIKQINSDYKCNDKMLRRCLAEVTTVTRQIGNIINFCNVPRSNQYIQKADQLCNEILDV